MNLGFCKFWYVREFHVIGINNECESESHPTANNNNNDDNTSSCSQEHNTYCWSLHADISLSLYNTLWNVGIIITAILQMRKIKLREIK